MLRLPAPAICTVALLAASCAHRPPPTLRRTPLFMVDREGASVALVKAALAGRETYLILDTGAEQSILPYGFVTATGLRPRKYGDLYMDANGYQTLLQVVPDIPIRFEGEGDPGAMDFLFGASLPAGVGIFAPQGLIAPGFALTMDFVKEEVRYDPEEVALARLREAGAPVQEVAFRRCRNEGLAGNAHRVVEITVNGVPTSALVDTGSGRTSLHSDNPAIDSLKGRKGEKREIFGVTAVPGQSLVVDAIPVTFAGTTLSLRTVLLPSASGAAYTNAISCGKGMLGMDFLRHCRLVWGSSSLWASCRPA
ncbi:MAG TPA: hypothetical protein VMK66_15320 [Myxococcales bacterium]|nr:hypothetical protein [Myxococcales bacterium]